MVRLLNNMYAKKILKKGFKKIRKSYDKKVMVKYHKTESQEG